MINRVLARSSVFQELFAYYHSDSQTIEKAVKSLTNTFESIHNLYFFLIDIIPALTDLHEEQIERNKKRAYLREEYANPNLRLVNNRFTQKIRESEILADTLRKENLFWRDNDPLLRSLLDEILASSFYSNYLKNEEDSFDVDLRFWIDVLQKLTFRNRKLDDYLSDLSIYWIDSTKVLEKFEVEEISNIETLDEKTDALRQSEGYQTIRMSNSAVEIQKDFVLKTLRKATGEGDFSEELMPMFKDNEDEDFAYQLLRSSIIHQVQYREIIEEVLKNWDSERLADTDIILLQMGIAEFFGFPSISAVVTINEYIELAKTYSTVKSGSFVNGLLDTILNNLRSQGAIEK